MPPPPPPPPQLTFLPLKPYSLSFNVVYTQFIIIEIGFSKYLKKKKKKRTAPTPTPKKVQFKELKCILTTLFILNNVNICKSRPISLNNLNTFLIENS